jgi:glyoxylase-like metal-dependent hydrolase (beta-lactamase superfamily II)
MKTSPITANSFQLTRLALVNCYLVREPDGFTLIDTGIASSEDDILSSASALGAPIRRILLTHAHVDHVGSVDALQRSFPASNSPPTPAACRFSSARQINPYSPANPPARSKAACPASRPSPPASSPKANFTAPSVASKPPATSPVISPSSMSAMEPSSPATLSSA